MFVPREKTFAQLMGILEPTVLVVGDGLDGESLSAAVSHFQGESPERLTSQT
mgnify:FL=1